MAAFGFGATAGTTPGFGFGAGAGVAPAAGFGASTGGGFGAFGSTGAFGGSGGTGAATLSFGAGTGAGTGGGFGFGAGSTGAASTGGFGFGSGAATGAAGTGGFGLGAGTAAKPTLGFAGGFGAPATTGGFAALGSTPATGAGGLTGGLAGFGAAAQGTAAAPSLGFGAAAKPLGGFGLGAATGAASGGGMFGGMAGTALGGTAAAAAQVRPPAASGVDRIDNVVCPIEGVSRLLLETDEKGQAVLSKEAGEVLEALNQQIAAWSPWHPALLAHYGRLAQSGAFRAVEQKALQLQSLDAAALDKQLRELPPDMLQLVKVAMMPRFDAMTLQGPLNNNRTPPDVVENQWGTSDWKPLLDNPHSRFRHYVLQPLTQAQMKLPAEQRHGLNQTSSSSPNDPLFQSKLQENPNPYKYCVLPIVGFHQLLRRVKMQDEKLAEQHAVLQRLEGEVNRMREFQTVQLPKMLAHRRATQVELGRRALQVMRRLEMQRQQPTAPSSRDLQVLGERMDQVSQQLSTTLQRRLQRLEEVMGELRMQDRKRLKQRPVAAATCDQEALLRLDAFLEHRKTGIAHLRDIVAKDLQDMQLIQTKL